MRRSRIGLLCSAVVLTIVGSLPPAAVAQPTPSPDGSGSGSGHGDMLAGVLHGEGIVQTKKGPIRVAMQNGEATALTPTSVTVRSSDGYTRTWAVGDDLKVYDKRHTLQPGALKAGVDLAIAGTAPIKATATPSLNGPSASPSATSYTARVVLVQSA
jgi:hypothetical protein